MTQLTIAIVGLGPWGLCVLDRLLAWSRRDSSLRLTIHVFEPGAPGAGVHTLDEPEYLLMNTACGQVSAFGAHGIADDTGFPGLTLYEWTLRQGYEMVDGECREPGRSAPGSRARPIVRHDFLPRRVLGAYLVWAFGRLTEDLPSSTALTRWSDQVVNIERTPDGKEAIETAQGPMIIADEVFLTTGHTANRVRPGEPGFIRTYPTTALHGRVRPGQLVAIAGMGLVAVDALTALTTGRGGRFETADEAYGLRYVPSGSEPKIALYSRAGLPFCCRPAVALDTAGIFRPDIFTDEALAERRQAKAHRTGDPRLDFREDVMPLLWAEMSILYHERRTLLCAGAEGAEAVRTDLLAAWRAGSLSDALASCAGRYEPFDPHWIFFRPDMARCSTGGVYEQKVRMSLVDDLTESRRGEDGSPTKAALELLRVLRDNIRSAVDFGGLTPSSFKDFRQRIAPSINRVIVGPPLRRGAELLALMDAGVVRVPFGPAPTVSPPASGRSWEITSTTLKAPVRMEVDCIVEGYLPQPAVLASQSTLVSRLCTAGRIRPFDVAAGDDVGIDVGRDCHPRDASGRPQERLWVLGPLTEGPRYFVQYIPSPKSRVRAFLEADQCVQRIWRRATGTEPRPDGG